MSSQKITSGNLIRAARAGIGWTQDALAEKAGVHVQAVKHWERSHAISPEQATGHAVQKITNALGRAGVEFHAEPVPGITFREVADAR